MTPYLIGHGEVRISSARTNSSKWAIALQPHGQVWRYDIKGGGQPHELPHEVRSDTQPVFSRYSPDHIFTVNGNQIWQHDLRNGGFELVASFTQFVSLSAAYAEGDLTPDGWLSLAGLGQDGTVNVFCYNLHEKKSGSVIQLSGSIDGLKAAIGGWLLVSNDNGIRAYSVTGGSHQVVSANGHAATAVWNGRPTLLWFSNARTSPWSNDVELIDIEDPSVVRILMGFGRDNYAGHVSAGPDSAYISNYDPTVVLPNQIWKAPFDGSARTLLHEWRPVYRGYESTPRASYSDGHLLWNVDNGQEVNVLGLKLESTPNAVQVDTPPSDHPDNWPEVSLENEPDADYHMILQVRGGKALPWKMWKKTL